jgi:hypothetical protein
VTAAAIYARVSSARQAKDETIGSQLSALREHAATSRLEVPQDWVLADEGHSGATLVRPALEALRDLAAQGCLDVVLVYSPDRLARKFAAARGMRGQHGPECSVSTILDRVPSRRCPSRDRSRPRRDRPHRLVPLPDLPQQLLNRHPGLFATPPAQVVTHQLLQTVIDRNKLGPMISEWLKPRRTC